MTCNFLWVDELIGLKGKSMSKLLRRNFIVLLASASAQAAHASQLDELSEPILLPHCMPLAIREKADGPIAVISCMSDPVLNKCVCHMAVCQIDSLEKLNQHLADQDEGKLIDALEGGFQLFTLRINEQREFKVFGKRVVWIAGTSRFGYLQLVNFRETTEVGLVDTSVTYPPFGQKDLFSINQYVFKSKEIKKNIERVERADAKITLENRRSLAQ
jgi:hypothetical protein